MDAEAVVYLVPATEALVLSAVERNGKKLWRKELIYEGDFTKKTPNQTIKFSVNKALIEHWHNTHKQLGANGVEVPLPLAHIFDEDAINNPLNKKATLVDTEVAKNKKGLNALYGLIEFKDAESEKELKHSDVSVYVPGEFTDGKGNTYYRPIRHVCFTDFPTIPGLEKFQALAASLASNDPPNPNPVDPPIKEKNMPFNPKAIAKKLGVNPDLTETALEAALETEIDKLLEKANAKDQKPEAIAAAFVTMAKNSRNDKLKQLVKDAKITPAVETELQGIFANDKTLALSLSLSDDKSDVVERDSFTKVIEALAKNDPIKLKEQTRAQSLALAHPSKDEEDNMIVKNAKQRAEAAATK